MTWGVGLAKGTRKPQCGGSAQFGDARGLKEYVHWHLTGGALRGLEVTVWG